MIKSKKIKKEYKLRYENKSGERELILRQLLFLRQDIEEKKRRILNMIDDFSMLN